MLSVSGIEDVKFQYRTSHTYYTGSGKNRRRRTRYSYHKTSGNRVIFNETKVVSSVSFGQYSIPFSFQLPIDIPNSFEI